MATLAASREFPLSSSFRPTYNMTANLVDRYDRDTAHEVLSRSFAQFQADRAVVRLEARRARLTEELDALTGTAPDNATEVFDVGGYAAAQDAAASRPAIVTGLTRATSRTRWPACVPATSSSGATTRVRSCWSCWPCRTDGAARSRSGPPAPPVGP